MQCATTFRLCDNLPGAATGAAGRTYQAPAGVGVQTLEALKYGKTPTPSPPSQLGLSGRQKKADEQRAQNEAKVTADLSAKMAAEKLF